MLIDLLIVAVTISLLTFLTATKHNMISRLKHNSITSGLLLTIIQLMLFISRLDCVNAELSEFYNVVISVLIKFRPLLVGALFKIIFGIVEDIQNKQNSKQDDKANVKEKVAALDFSVLSRREIEVARLASKGYTNSQIAECLYISTETVKSHMNSIFEKLEISSRKELLNK